MNAQLEAHPNFDNVAISAGKFFFRYRNAIFPLVFLVTVLLVRPDIPVAHPRFDRFLTAAGLVIALAGQLFRFLVIGLSYIERGGRHGEVFASSLVTTGLYSHSRNPMYFGNALIAIGFVLALGSYTASATLIPFFLFVYYSIVANEEAYLRTQFPDRYAKYEADVPRFIPRMAGIGATFLQFDFDWRKALRKEYCTLFASFAGVLFMIFFKSALRSSHEFTFVGLLQTRFPVWLTVILLGFLVTRAAKKTKII